MDKDALRTLAAGLERVLASEAGQAPLGRQVLLRTETVLRDVRGAPRVVKVQLQAMPTDSDAFVNDGGFGQNTLVLNVNGSVPAARLAKAAAAGTLASRLYATLLHEATHAAEGLFSRGKVAHPDEDPTAYANDPREVRAYLQEIVDEIDRDHAQELMEVFGPSKGLEYVLKTSQRWLQLSPYWTEANRRRVIRAVAQAVGGAA